MANPDKAGGLVPVGYLSGAKYGGAARSYAIAAADANAFAVGDPVVIAGDADADGVPTVTLATAGTGNQILGSIVSGAGGLKYGQPYGVPADSPLVIPATKTRIYYVLVADDPNLIFEIQEDGVGGTIAAASVGLNANLIAGANNGFISTWELDSSTVAAGATLQVKLLRAQQRRDNALGSECKWLVKINHHCFAPGQTGL